MGVTKADVYAMLQAWTSRQRVGASALSGAFANSAYVNGESIGAPGAAPTAYNFQTILLTAQLSGVFAVGLDIPFNSGTAADAIQLKLSTQGWSTANWVTDSATGKFLLTGATKVGVTGAGVGAAINAGTPPGVYQCTAGGTTITNTATQTVATTSVQAGGGTTAATGAFGTLAGLLTANGMQWWGGSALVYSVLTTFKTQFAKGSPVAFDFICNATNTLTMAGSASFWAFELPNF